MIKTARQLKDLIRNLSREKSADAQLLMRNYMMERFLERISLCLPLLWPFVFDFSKPHRFKTSCEKRMLMIYYR